MKDQKFFTVGLVSNQISQNYIAWSNDQATFDTLEEAKIAAEVIWEEVCQNADNYGSGYVGVTLIIHDGKNIVG